MDNGKMWAFVAGVAVGVAAVCFVKSEMGHKTAVAIAEKGMALKDRVLEAKDRVKEAASDIAAEARYLMEQKANA
ncbi:MAG: YtxH domain-containing protein [Fretibacterium sp.]|nr:YtxH domain-containing protein [Fretibacterium sp.]